MSTREWPISYWHYVPGPSSPIQMMRGAMKCMDCGGVKPGETVLISTDTNKFRIAEALASAVYAVALRRSSSWSRPSKPMGSSFQSRLSLPSGRQMCF